MDAQSLASPENFERFEPTCATTLDAHLQQEEESRSAVASGEFVERLFKLFGLFASHLVLREAHLLDHLAMRSFFLDLRQDSRREVVEYLTRPGKDPLGLGPVVLSSEGYDHVDRHHAFPLRELLKRKLGSDERRYNPWELSSVYNLADLSAANQAVQAAAPEKRFEVATKCLAPDGTYETFLNLASSVWDQHASTTRIPWEKADFLGVLRRSLSEAAKGSGESASSAHAVLQWIQGDKLVLPDGTEKRITRSTLNPELRRMPSGYPLQWLVNGADWEAFLLSFPSKRGWATANHPKLLGYWRSPEAGSTPQPKREVQEAVSLVAEGTGGSIALDTIQFSQISALRNSQSFQDSLSRIRLEWVCHSRHALAEALRDHVLLIYRELGLHKRSSPSLRPGPDVTVEVGAAASQEALSFFAYAQHHPLISLSSGALTALVKSAVSWLRRKTALKRDLKDLARQVADASVDTTRTTQS